MLEYHRESFIKLNKSLSKEYCFEKKTSEDIQVKRTTEEVRKLSETLKNLELRKQYLEQFSKAQRAAVEGFREN